MNGDAVNFAERFLNDDSVELPPNTPKSHQLILFALRAVRTEVLDKIEEMAKSQEKLEKILLGEKPDGSDGLVQRFNVNEEKVKKAEKAVAWLRVTVYGSIITGVLAWILSNVFK